MRKVRQSQFWWESPIDELALHDLVQLKGSIEELKKKMRNFINKCIIEQSNTFSSNMRANGFERYDSLDNNFGLGINIVPTHHNSYYLDFRNGFL